MNNHNNTIKQCLEQLSGRKAPIEDVDPPGSVIELLTNPDSPGLSHSQLNELLLHYGLDRIPFAYFFYLVNGKLPPNETKEENETVEDLRISSLEELIEGIKRSLKVALLLYGNVKFGYKRWSKSEDLFWANILTVLPQEEEKGFLDRNDPIFPIHHIPASDAFNLGYIIEDGIEKRLEADPDDPVALKQIEDRSPVVELGKLNQNAYLASDHMDVYVATSMRGKHEFQQIQNLTKEIFSHPELEPLKLRYFDPTQAYCKDRIDKGLAEALMLKRAECTIYLAQQSDSLGKDSELASTLAQGKPVIAYVPEIPADQAKVLITELVEEYPEKSKAELVIDQLQQINPKLAWYDAEVRNWLNDPDSMDISKGLNRLQEAIKDHFDDRAKTLRKTHPLGIQVNLAEGVANGVLVVRNVETCAKLVKSIVTRNLKFHLKVKQKDELIDFDEVNYLTQGSHLCLVEKISNSVFRVMTNDTMLSNAFWNFYLP